MSRDIAPPIAAHKPNESCECNKCLNYYTDVAKAAAIAPRQERDAAVKLGNKPAGTTPAYRYRYCGSL